MNRKGDGGSHVDELMGLVIGFAGAVCVWLGGIAVGAGELVGGNWRGGDGLGGWVEHPDGVVRWFDGRGWYGSESEMFSWYAENGSDGEGAGFPGDRVVLLVHGLDEPGGIWDDVAPALFESGYRVARFDYPNDQSVVRSAEGLEDSIGWLGEQGVERVDLVAHSMGGLVSREALTSPAMGDSSGMIGGVDIGRLILVGTPNEGSAWAKLRGVAEVRERVQRWVASDELDVGLLGKLAEDGDGQAGTDLQPGSEFLTKLNSRTMPKSVPVTCIVGRVIAPVQTKGLGAVDEAANALGDGVVSVESASLDGCDDVVLFVANHRSLIRTVEVEEAWRMMVGFERAENPMGIWIILDRLGWDPEPE
ncbi:MAG: alpha/beta fold hydrolase [Phycisphaerales bacterium]|nr:alpha/beta fold hydrolase [Phycisphaerales bacterium]